MKTGRDTDILGLHLLGESVALPERSARSNGMKKPEKHEWPEDAMAQLAPDRNPSFPSFASVPGSGRHHARAIRLAANTF